MKAHGNYASITKVGSQIIVLALYCILASGCRRKDESASTKPPVLTSQLQDSTTDVSTATVDLASERSAFKTHLLRHLYGNASHRAVYILNSDAVRCHERSDFLIHDRHNRPDEVSAAVVVEISEAVNAHGYQSRCGIQGR
jgi:hypothetical protein